MGAAVHADVVTRLRDGARAAAPLAPGPVLFGASFGLLAQAAGMSPLAAIVMSATTFAGSAQFAAASVLEQGGGVVAAVVAAVLLNARYVPISVTVASIFPGRAARRLLRAPRNASCALSRTAWPRLYRREAAATGCREARARGLTPKAPPPGPP